MNFLKFIELCFQTVVPGCEYNDYQYIKVIADRLEAANAGEVRRIIFNMPPRSMKSICMSVAWPAWILGNCKNNIVFSKMNDKFPLWYYQPKVVSLYIYALKV